MADATDEQLPNLEPIDWDHSSETALHTAVRDYFRRAHELTDFGKMVGGFATTGAADIEANDDGSIRLSADQFQFLMNELFALRHAATYLAVVIDPRT